MRYVTSVLKKILHLKGDSEHMRKNPYIDRDYYGYLYNPQYASWARYGESRRGEGDTTLWVHATNADVSGWTDPNFKIKGERFYIGGGPNAELFGKNLVFVKYKPTNIFDSDEIEYKDSQLEAFFECAFKELESLSHKDKEVFVENHARFMHEPEDNLPTFDDLSKTRVIELLKSGLATSYFSYFETPYVQACLVKYGYTAYFENESGSGRNTAWEDINLAILPADFDNLEIVGIAVPTDPQRGHFECPNCQTKNNTKSDILEGTLYRGIVLCKDCATSDECSICNTLTPSTDIEHEEYDSWGDRSIICISCVEDRKCEYCEEFFDPTEIRSAKSTKTSVWGTHIERTTICDDCFEENREEFDEEQDPRSNPHQTLSELDRCTMATRDIRGRFFSEVVSQKMLENSEDLDLRGSVFYNCIFEASPHEMESFFDKHSEAVIQFNCFAVNETKLDLVNLCKGPKLTNTVKISFSTISGDLLESEEQLSKDGIESLPWVKNLAKLNFSDCKFENLTIKFDFEVENMTGFDFGDPNSDALLFEDCIFNTPSVCLDIRSKSSSFRDCEFSELLYHHTHPKTRSTTQSWGGSVEDFLAKGRFENCDFYRLRFLQLVGDPEYFNKYLGWFNYDLQFEYYRADYNLSKRITRDRRSEFLDTLDELKESMVEDFKARFTDCEFNILFPIFKVGSDNSPYGGDTYPDTLSTPRFNYTLWAMSGGEDRLTTNLNSYNEQESVFRYMQGNARTLEDFLTSIKTPEFEVNVFEEFTGYPRQVLEIAKKITFTFWHQKVVNLRIQGDSSKPIQNFEFAYTVSEVKQCIFRNLTLSLSQDAALGSEDNFCRLVNTHFGDCDLSIGNLICGSNVTFENCTFSQNSILGLATHVYRPNRDYEIPEIVFSRCDLRNLTLFKGIPDYQRVGNIQSANFAILDRFITFEDCLIDDTTLIETYDYKTNSLTKIKLSDLLAQI